MHGGHKGKGIRDSQPDVISKKPPIPGDILSLKVMKGEYHLTAKAIETKSFRAPMLPDENTHRMRAGSFVLYFETEDQAKRVCIAAGLDCCGVLEEWKASTLKNRMNLDNPNKAFLGCVKNTRNASR